MRKTRFFCLLLTVVLLCAVLFGCQGETAEQQEEPKADLEYTMTISSAEKGFEISPLIYGEFLEHITDCIYGVIWSEVIQDRKFYYPAGEEGLSPWKTSGSVTATEEGYSSEGYAAVLSSGGVLSQEVTAAKKAHTGYFYGAGKGKVEVSVGDHAETVDVSGDFTKYTFAATVTADKVDVSFRCVEGSVTLDSVSLMPADNYKGMRKDTLDALKDLGGTVYRWPGGNFVSGYDWKDGVGDRDKRPSRRNQAWFPDTGDIEDDKQRLAAGVGFYSRIEPNDLGTDEFLAMCDYIGAIPYLAVNTGSGTAESAAEYVEYCNGGVDTVCGALRAANGHAEPYNVKYWCVGNEMQGDWQIGHTSLAKYVQTHNAFVDAMRQKDGDIVVTGCGDNASGWTEGMFESCADRLDYIGEHLYVPRDTALSSARHILAAQDNFNSRITTHRELIQKYPDAAHVKIAFDEYAYHWNGQPIMKDAFGIAASLNLFIANADVVGMANYSDAVFDKGRTTSPGAMYTTTDSVAFTPIGYVLQAYARYMQPYALAVTVRQTSRETNLQYQGTVSADGKTVAVAVTNPSDKTVKLTLSGVSGQLLKSVRIEGVSDMSSAATRTETDKAGAMTVKPYSVNVFVLTIGK